MESSKNSAVFAEKQGSKEVEKKFVTKNSGISTLAVWLLHRSHMLQSEVIKNSNLSFSTESCWCSVEWNPNNIGSVIKYTIDNLAAMRVICFTIAKLYQVIY